MAKAVFCFFAIVVLLVSPLSLEARPLHAQNVINTFYLDRDGEPLWVRGKEISEAGEKLYSALQNSWMHGLNPNSYYVKEIESALAQNKVLNLELLLTSGYIRYVQDLSGMRVNAHDLDLRAKDWLQRISTKEAIALLPENLDEIGIFLESREPQTRTYQRLKDEMVKLVQATVIHEHKEIDKIRQIIVNMERLRWIPDEKPDRFIVVNISSARLWAIDNGSLAFTMPVVVGRKERPTLSFVTKIHGVRFNPNWTVPPTIKKEDILPHLQENPAYLAGKGMELRDGYGKDSLTLDPTSVDWNNLSDRQLNNLNMVQIPGSHNPLGRIRILMPNEHNIYLHDTNEKSLFRKTDRAQSSGCVRMKYPDKVAAFALENSVYGTQKYIDAILKTGETKDIYTNDFVTVYLLYYTVWLDDKNQVIYGKDIYDRDNALFHDLEKLDAVPIIMDNGGMLSASVN